MGFGAGFLRQLAVPDTWEVCSRRINNPSYYHVSMMPLQTIECVQSCTVTLANNSDALGSLVGILGVLIGGAIGFAGVYWQHAAQRDQEVKKLCAQLLTKGDGIYYAWMASDGSMQKKETVAFLAEIRSSLDLMELAKRQLELTTSGKLPILATEYYLECISIVNIASRECKKERIPAHEDKTKVIDRWCHAQIDFVRFLNPNGLYPRRSLVKRLRKSLAGWRSWTLLRRLRGE